MLLENGKYGIIRNVTLQQLETPETTYNFEVEDYHTYYVGEEGILTHNTGNCGGNLTDGAFNNWLNEGEANNTVYKGISQLGEEVYTGITKQKLTTRLAQYNSVRGGAKNFSNLEKKYLNLTRNQARSIETYMINDKRGLNKIRSIGENNKFYDQAKKWAERFITGG